MPTVTVDITELGEVLEKEDEGVTQSDRDQPRKPRVPGVGRGGRRRKQHLQVIERIDPRARRLGPREGALPRALLTVLVNRIQVVQTVGGAKLDERIGPDHASRSMRSDCITRPGSATRPHVWTLVAQRVQEAGQLGVRCMRLSRQSRAALTIKSAKIAKPHKADRFRIELAHPLTRRTYS